MNSQRHTVSVTTIVDGSATAYTSGDVTGAVLSVTYTKADFADGVDFTITTETTLQNVWTDTNINASEVVNPLAGVNSADGAALLHAAGGTAVPAFIYAVQERIKIVIASGGNAKTGTFTIVTG